MTEQPADYDSYVVDNFRGPSVIGGGEPQPSVTVDP